jgi:hypothetical protein
MIRQATGGERMEESKLIETEMARQMKSTVKSMKGILYKEFFWQLNQSIPHTTVTFMATV